MAMRRARLAGLAVVLLLAGLAGQARAATFTVNATDDASDGACDVTHCSLREAIDAANAAPGADRIEFAIPGAGIHTIAVPLALPYVEGDLTIDGYTQPGASANTNATGGLNTVLRVEVRGGNINNGAAGFRIIGSNVTIRGFAIAQFAVGLYADAALATNINLTGNFLGTDATGTTAPGAYYGVLMSSAAGVTVGGGAPADRNLISGNAFRGIFLNRQSADPLHIVVQGNLIGTRADGITALGNGDALVFNYNSEATAPGDYVLIGGSNAGEGNVVGGNTNALDVSTTQSTQSGSTFSIIGNTFGTDATRTVALPNVASSIVLNGPLHVLVENNVITNGGGTGISISGTLTTDGRGTGIRNNSIYGNGSFGIDLGNDGRTLNDAGDADGGPNARLNFPVLATAQRDGTSGVTRLAGTVDAEPNTAYLVQLFGLGLSSRPHGFDATARVYELSVTTDASGVFAFDLFGVLNSVNAGESLVATLTGTVAGYTSEISDPIVITTAGPGVEVGTYLAGGGAPLSHVSVSLTGTETRHAFSNDGGTAMFFDMTAGGTYTITPEAIGYTFAPASITVSNVVSYQSLRFDATPVPVAAYTVNVAHDAGDGVCLPAECTLREAIDAANAHPGPDTIHFAIPGAGVQTIPIDSRLPDLESDITIDGYSQAGARPNTRATGGLDTKLTIALAPTATTGADARGLFLHGNRVTVRGLAIDGFSDGIIVRVGAGIGQQVAIEGNFIGTTPSGLDAGLDSLRGVGVTGSGSGAVTIGGLTPASRNLISSHTDSGIYWTSTETPDVLTLHVQGNLIGTDATGLAALPNNLGISMPGGGQTSADIVRIGGATAATGNVIAASFGGILIARGSFIDLPASDQVIIGNYIGVASDGVTLFDSMAIGVYICGSARYTVRANMIANSSTGIGFCGNDPGRVTISANRMFDIYGIGIDLGFDGPTANDQDDADVGSNDLQNFPELSVAQERLAGVDIVGALVSRSQRSYRIEIFRTGVGWMAARDSRELIDSFTVATDQGGMAAFTRHVAALASGEAVTATATDELTGMTSEMSGSLDVTPLPRRMLTGLVVMDGVPLAGIGMELTGDRTQTTRTDSDGYFEFTQLPRTGNYQITPADATYRYTPPVAIFANLQDDEFVKFEAIPTTYTRYFAEGAAGAFWETSIALLNPSRTATTVDVAFLLSDGRTENLSVLMNGPGHAVIDAATIPALNGATFSTTVRASEAIVASRTMRWGTERELGAHAEQAVSEPRTAWYFAEGATGCFDLFYQLANPGATPADVEMTFVRRAPQEPVVRHYTVAPFARFTVRANIEEGLDFAEVSARIRVTNGQPIVAERAMYSNCFGTNWRGGHVAAGSAAPGMTWRLAEGATGSFFDLYLLLANFETTTAEVDVQYMLPDGSLILKPYRIPAGSRLTIDVAGEAPQLVNAAISTYVSSSNGVPIVAERSQWWPHGQWYEGHVSAGAPTFGYEWHVAGAQVGGPHGVSGYLLIGNTGNRTGAAEVTAVFADGSTVTLPETVALPGHSRTTVDLAAAFPQAKDQSFGLIVKSIGTNRAPIVVELSNYSDTHGADGTRFWGAGTNLFGTRVH